MTTISGTKPFSVCNHCKMLSYLLDVWSCYLKVSKGNYAFMNSEAALKYIISSDYTDKSGTILFNIYLNAVI